MNKDWHSLDEVNSGHSIERVTFGLTLPDYAPSEDISVNIPRIGRIARLGGLKSIEVTSYSGDTTTFTPEIDRIDDHGTATATNKGVAHVAETQRSSITEESNDNYHYAYHSSPARIEINQEELEDDILQNKGSLRDPKVWSERLDSALKAGLREASRKSLIDGKYKRNSFLACTAVGGLVMEPLLEGIPSGAVDLSTKEGIAIVVYHIAMQMTNSVSSSMEGLTLNQRRKSIFYGSQWDRYAAVQALTRTQRMAEAAKSK